MMQKTFTGVPAAKKKDAEQSAAAEALRQLQIAAWANPQKKNMRQMRREERMRCFCWDVSAGS